MQTVLIVIHLLVVLALVGVVLLQRSEGGALGMGGGGAGGVSGFLTGRGQANALTRATAILAAIFFATSILLSILASHNRTPTSIIPTGAGAPPAVPTAPGAPGQPAAPTGGGVLDQLQRMQGTPAPAPAPETPPQVPQSR